jgi:hypothetical protein
LEIKPRVDKKKALFPVPHIGFIVFGAPPLHNPYLTKMANQLGSTLLVTYADRDTFSISLEFLNNRFRFPP